MIGSPASATDNQQPPEATPRVSFEEFLARSDEDARAEWVDGEVLLMSPASADHQRLAFFLGRLMAIFVDARGLGEVFVAPFLMRLANRPSGREPDLLFIAADHADRVRETYLDGPADLVVEIVSPDSDARDRGDKFVEYEAAGLREYWLIDPLRKDPAFYVLDPDGRYRRAPIDPDGFYHSTVLFGFRLDTAWLWQRPLPPIAEVTQLIQA